MVEPRTPGRRGSWAYAWGGPGFKGKGQSGGKEPILCLALWSPPDPPSRTWAWTGDQPGSNARLSTSSNPLELAVLTHIIKSSSQFQCIAYPRSASHVSTTAVEHSTETRYRNNFAYLRAA
ncbi:hypothetical protein HZ326_24493 [Fusarium oxysporum f. sp. albedinis]|nr:hypothetical protein HZ326_24493 [Fusarium oxysporum f. sp. albedinis]